MTKDLRMNRRELLQQVAWLMGGTVATPAVLAVLNGCSRKPSVGAPLVLDEAQRALIAEVAEIIIPRTDTPGAQDVGVPRFIDTMLHEAFSSEEQQSFISGLQDFEVAAQRAHGKPFLQLSQSQRVAFARKLHDDIVAEAKARQKLQLGWRKLQEQSAVPVGQLRAIKKRLRAMVGSQAQRPTRSFILTMKELTMLGYFTSEVGATQILQYLPVPGRQQGCIPLREAGNGKTWALETSYRF